MQRLERLIVVFALLFAVFIILPAFLNAKFPLYPLMTVADVFDLATPWILLGLYWLLLQWGGADVPTLREQFFFVLFAALWAQGQGMHLAANSIGHLLGATKESDAYALMHFYDEVLSHYLWHLGMVGLAALLLVRQWRSPFRNQASTSVLKIAAAVIYGVTTFVSAIEAGTVPLILPFALIVAGFTLIRGRTSLRTQPLLVFFGSAYLLAAILLIGWGIYWRGFPQFSEIGLLQ